MSHLAELDQVAFVRYASVYRDFQDASDFNQFVMAITPEQVQAGAVFQDKMLSLMKFNEPDGT